VFKLKNKKWSRVIESEGYFILCEILCENVWECVLFVKCVCFDEGGGRGRRMEYFFVFVSRVLRVRGLDEREGA